MAELLRVEALRLAPEGGLGGLEDFQARVEAGARLRLPASRTTSALLRLLAGLQTPEGGRVLVAGRPIDPYAQDHPFRARGALAWVPTEGGLLANLSLLANLALPLRFLRGLGREDAEALAEDALARADLAHLADARPHALSPQERWTGALARAALLAPELWLVDAPPGLLELESARRARILLAPSLARPETTALVAGGEWLEGIWQRVELTASRLVEVEP